MTAFQVQRLVVSVSATYALCYGRAFIPMGYEHDAETVKREKNQSRISPFTSTRHSRHSPLYIFSVPIGILSVFPLSPYSVIRFF